LAQGLLNNRAATQKPQAKNESVIGNKSIRQSDQLCEALKKHARLLALFSRIFYTFY
jgi:hypothetical protein